MTKPQAKRLRDIRLLPEDLPVEELWKSLALCRGLDPALFYGGVEPDQAKAVCRRCPVDRACLEYALAYGETEGIWGGMTAEERGKRESLTHPQGEVGS